MSGRLLIDVGTLQFLGEAVGRGINGPRVALARFGGADARVIVKRIEPRKIAAEMFGALLAQEAGFQYARPGIVQDRTTELWWYSSRMQGSPDLTRRFGITAGLPPAAAERQLRMLVEWLSSCPAFPSIVAWDEWANNRDRNLGNLLVNGDDLVLIDHEEAFDCHREHYQDVNVLASFVNEAFSQAAQLKVKNGAVAGSLSFRKDWTQNIDRVIQALGGEIAANAGIIRAWTADRHPSVPRRVQERLKAGQIHLPL